MAVDFEVQIKVGSKAIKDSDVVKGKVRHVGIYEHELRVVNLR